MNQILSVEQIKKQSKKRKSGLEGNVSDVVKIVRFFAIALIIFGIFNIGTASYAMYKKKQDDANRPVKPEIVIDKISEKQIQLTVRSSNPINEVYYKWDSDDTEKKLTGNAREEITEKITVPAGENRLFVRATNTSGQVQTLEYRSVRESNISIQIEKEDPYIKVKLEGKDKLEYMTYRWNDEETTKINIDSKTSEQQIRAISGENTLTITVFDIKGKSEEIVKQVKGVEELSKPSVEITTDGSENFIIKASDQEGLKKIEFIINETDGFMLNLDGRKELEYPYPLREGENKIEVTVYNMNDETAEFKAKLTK